MKTGSSGELDFTQKFHRTAHLQIRGPDADVDVV